MPVHFELDTGSRKSSAIEASACEARARESFVAPIGRAVWRFDAASVNKASVGRKSRS